MTKDREALEDAFDRAEGQLEVSFRRYLKAKRQERTILKKNLTILRGKEAYDKLVSLASKLSSIKR
jgi:hypothetical protein